MKILNFNPDGSLKIPEHLKKKKVDLDNTIILKYEKEYWSDTIDCNFTIIIPKTIDKQNLNEIEDWVDNQVKTNPISTSIEIEELTPHKFKLLISGKGHDNRCTWCRSFRTSLKTFCNKKGIDYLQNKFCKFDK